MNQPEKKPGHAGTWLTAALLLPVIYLLSIGPAARWTKSNPGNYPTLLRIYAPLETLFHTPLEQPLKSYLRWWTR